MKCVKETATRPKSNNKKKIYRMQLNSKTYKSTKITNDTTLKKARDSWLAQVQKYGGLNNI